MAPAPASEDMLATRDAIAIREMERRSFWRRAQAFMLARPGLARLGVIAVLLGIWEIAARFYVDKMFLSCLLYTSPSPRDRTRSRMPSSA